jgi:hypothetical protein
MIKATHRLRCASPLSFTVPSATFPIQPPSLISSLSTHRSAPARRAVASAGPYTLTISRVVPDESRTLAEGTVKPWQTESYRECQDDLMRFARRRGIPTNVPWRELTGRERRWVLEGEGDWEEGLWYGVARFFDGLRRRATRCISGSCSRSTAPIRRVRPALGHGSSQRRSVAPWHPSRCRPCTYA